MFFNIAVSTAVFVWQQMTGIWSLELVWKNRMYQFVFPAFRYWVVLCRNIFSVSVFLSIFCCYFSPRAAMNSDWFSRVALRFLELNLWNVMVRSDEKGTNVPFDLRSEHVTSSIRRLTTRTFLTSCQREACAVYMCVVSRKLTLCCRCDQTFFTLADRVW
jgi:hypothetical protein